MENRILKTKINNIIKKLNDDEKLIEVLQDIIEIATFFDDKEIIDWINNEISGYYADEKNIPSYRNITCQKIKNNEKRIIRYILHNPIILFLEQSKKEGDYLFNVTSGDEGNFEISVNHHLFKKIIESVKIRIREYLSKISKEKLEANNKNKEKRKTKILEELSSSSLKTYLKDNRELNIFKKELNSLMEFEFLNNHKYSMIVMGSILEFLLKRYCDSKTISPIDRTGTIVNKNDATFVNYIQSAINNDIFREYKRWQIVQDNLRDFRNYIHIEKELSSPNIDKNWYDTIKPVFYALYDYFKKNPI